MTLDLATPVLHLPRTDHLPPLRTGVIDSTRRSIAAAFRSWYDIHLHDQHHVPTSGPVILASNHPGTLDGPMLVVFNPRSLALAKSELFESKVGPFLNLAGQIPVSRDYHDIAAVRRCVQVLQAGRPLAIFPEGRRGLGDMTQLKGGAAYLAMVTGAPIVPVCVLGTRLPGEHLKSVPPKGSPIHIVYGGQVRIPTREWPRRKTDIAEATAYLTQVCSEHVRWAELKTGMRLPAV